MEPEDDAGPPERDSGAEEEGSRVEPFVFDLALLANPHADPETRDREWFRFYDHFRPRLVSYFERRTGPAELDETLAHIWRTALAGIVRLRSPAAAWNWLRAVGENFLRSERRSASERRQTRQAALPKLQQEEGVRRAGEAVLERLAAADAFDEGRWPIDRPTLHERWARLDPDERRVIEMRVHEDLEFAAIAQRIGISSVAARQRYSRAMRRLRDG
jgi:RNA polymerase sigma factor (sigma-70 family)